MTMREIGGYMDFERFHGSMLHEKGIKLNCGRNCLSYLIEARGIRKIRMPYWMCDSVFDVCEAHHVELRFYHISREMKPIIDGLDGDEWLYLMNYYGQLTVDEIREYAVRYGRVILDNAQAYFDEPIDGVDTLYTCRKFLGVPDGAILFTDAVLTNVFETESSHPYMTHLLGRLEVNGSAFYAQSVDNNRRFKGAPIRNMSKLTENLLRAIDYDLVAQRRRDNFQCLNDLLIDLNGLKPRCVNGAFAYPLLITRGSELRKKLIKNKIYVPVLWPNVIDSMAAEDIEFQLTSDLLPLPCDQRYDTEDMQYIAKLVHTFL